MAYPYTQTQTHGGIQAGLSTQISVLVGDQEVGAIQTLTSNQSRRIKRFGEVGTDGTVELVPEARTEITIDVTRLVFDRKRLTEAFQRAFMNIQSQRVPFDIQIKDFSNLSTGEDGGDLSNIDINDYASAGEEGVITMVYENCWFNKLSVGYNADSYLISETAGIDCENIVTYADGPSQNKASSVETNDGLEPLADRGHRGSLDARGINAVEFYSNNSAN